MNNKQGNSGAIYVLLGAIAFSLGGLLVKLIPWQAVSINAGRCIFSSLIIYLYIRFTGHRIIFNKTTITGGICVMLMLMTYVLANKLTTAANAIVLEYTAPIFVIIFEGLFFHKKVSLAAIIVCLLVFSGIAIVMIDGLSAGNIIGDLVAIMSGIFYAITIMLNDFKDGDSLSSVLFGHLLTVILGFYSIFTESDFSLRTLSLIAILGIFQAGAGYTLLAAGLKKCDAVTGSLVASIEPVLNPLLVALFYGEYMSPTAIIGAFIVIVSVVFYNVLISRQT